MCAYVVRGTGLDFKSLAGGRVVYGKAAATRRKDCTMLAQGPTQPEGARNRRASPLPSRSLEALPKSFQEGGTADMFSV